MGQKNKNSRRTKTATKKKNTTTTKSGILFDHRLPNHTIDTR